MTCAISCGKTRKKLKKNMLQQADEVEATRSQKKADYQHLPFHANVKTHCKYRYKKPPVHITPRAAVKINTSVFQKKKS
jgi:hypothetical protein